MNGFAARHALLGLLAIVIWLVVASVAASAQILTPSRSLPNAPAAERRAEPPAATEATPTATDQKKPVQPIERVEAARDAAGLVAIPELSARVIDTANLLGASETDDFAARLKALEQRKGSQLVLLIVPTTEPEGIEQFAIRVFDKWRLGRANIDDGVLLLIARDDRRARIEVGRGLEGVIPDAIANRLIDDYLVPRFKAGDYRGGIDDVTTALVRLIDGEALPEPTASRDGGGERAFGGLMPAVVLAFILASFLQALRGIWRPLLVTAGNSGMGWLLAGAGSVLLWAIVGFVVAMVVGVLGGGGGGRGRAARSGGWGNYGGFPSSGGGGFGGGGGGGSFGGGGGGFSGGGGMSAGGGASGSW